MEDTKLRLPLTRVKKIAKMNLAYNISADAAKLLTLATEKYVELMGKCSWNWALANSRKTIQIADIAQCVQRDWMFAILEDALENWPDESSVPIADGAGEEAAAMGSEAENSADENEAIYDGNEDVDVAEMDESFQHEAQIDNDNIAEHDVVESQIDLPINSLPKDIEDL